MSFDILSICLSVNRSVDRLIGWLNVVAGLTSKISVGLRRGTYVRFFFLFCRGGGIGD